MGVYVAGQDACIVARKLRIDGEGEHLAFMLRKPKEFAAGVIRAADRIANLLLGSFKEIKADVHI